jgi:hypothetical protein
MNDKSLMRALRAVDALEVEKAPKEHPLRTPRCPPLTRFSAGVREGWTPEEREHVTGCPYCQHVTALEWRAECPSSFDWAPYLEGRSPDQGAMNYHLEHDRCPRCQDLVVSLCVTDRRLKRWRFEVVQEAGPIVTALPQAASDEAAARNSGARQKKPPVAEEK